MADYYVMDWMKAAKIIVRLEEREIDYVEAGLMGDWAATSGVIWRNGAPTTVEDFFFGSSWWAIPTIKIHFKDGGSTTFDCYTTSESRGDSYRKWDEESLAYLESYHKETEKNSEKTPPRATKSISIANTMKAIKANGDALRTDIKRIKRVKDSLSEEDRDEFKRLILLIARDLMEEISDGAPSTSDTMEEPERSDDELQRYDDFDSEKEFLILTYFFKNLPSMFKTMLEKMEKEGKETASFEEPLTTGLYFIENFSKVMETFVLEHLLNGVDELKDFVGSNKYN